MKILKIRFENIHSLKDRHEVDFEKGYLADAGLFAITGPTGSGKSTLLDVITLALYNRIARVDKTVSNSMLDDDGGVMTRNMKHCFAEVEYRVNGIDYRSHWSIERNRNNNLNARKQEVVEVATGYILESGTKTPEKNKELIGLSYDQFVKAIVLSQGEFSKLLQAPRNDRNKLLEDITGAASYRKIGESVYARFKKIEREIQLKEAGLENIQLLSKEAIVEKNNELKILNADKPKIENCHQKASDKINIRYELESREKEWNQLSTEKSALQKDIEILEPYQIKLNVHEKLSKYNDNLRRYDLVNKDHERLSEHYQQLSKSKNVAEELQNNYLKEISLLIKEAVTIETANAKLETFRNQITALQSEEEKKFQASNLHRDQLNTYVHNLNSFGYPLPKAEIFETFQPSFHSLKETIQESIKESKIASISELEETLKAQRHLIDVAKSLITRKEEDLKLDLKIKKNQSELKLLDENLLKALKQIKQLTITVETLKKEVEKLEADLERERRHQSLETHRLQLTVDEPCPLCGSLDHPYALDKPHFDTQAELLKAKKNVLDTNIKLVISLEEQNTFQKKDISRLKSEIQIWSKEKEQNKPELGQFATLLKWNSELSVENLNVEFQNLQKDIQTNERLKLTFQASSTWMDASKSLELWVQNHTDYTSKRNVRLALYESNDINKKTNALSSKIIGATTEIKTLDKQLLECVEKLKSVTKDLSNQNQKLENILQKEQLHDLDTLRKAILSEEIATKIRNQQNVLNEKKTRLSEKENVLQKLLNDLRAKDDAKIALEDLKTDFESSKKEHEGLERNIGKIQQIIYADSEARERQKKVLAALDMLKKDLALWKTMNDLIGDSKGNKFSNFVQDLTLEQLIGFTNKRLSEFSDRYLLDIPTAEEAEKSDTLKVFDSYMGNTRRSVRTLSGGETFLVSLTMAFALSDIASRNVKIESLFIDEGFGTLDPETLDQAITILEKMQNEGQKSVGIISHVSALKDRITTQIQLRKSSLGYSTLEIVQ